MRARKTRADAKENALTESAREELSALVERNAPLVDVQAFFQRHGMELSLAGAHRVSARARAALERAAAAGNVVKALAAAGNAATSVKAATVLGDVVLASLDLEDPDAREMLVSTARTLADIYRTEIAAETARTRRAALALEREKFECAVAERLLDEALAARAAKVASSTAPKAEKIKALRQLYFADVDALEQSGEVRLPA